VAQDRDRWRALVNTVMNLWVLAPQRCNTAKLTCEAVYHKYSLTAARHATVVVAVPSTVHCPVNYKIKYIISGEI
jgi:hypothetical protein